MSSNERINQLTILTPCTLNWDELEGNRRTRFCQECGKNVHDFRNMTEAEVIAVMDNSPNDFCARITRTQDGQVITRPSLMPLRFNIRSLMILVAFVAAMMWYMKTLVFDSLGTKFGGRPASIYPPGGSYPGGPSS